MIKIEQATQNSLSRIYEVLELCERSSHGFPVYGEIALLNGVPNQMGVAVTDRMVRARGWKLIPQSRIVEVAESTQEVERYYSDYEDYKRPHLRKDWSDVQVGYVRYSMATDIWESIIKVGGLPYDEIARAITPGPIWDLSRKEFPEVYASGRLLSEVYQRTLQLPSR